jgi:hypothetical protein
MTHSRDDACDWHRMFPEGVWKRRVEITGGGVVEPSPGDASVGVGPLSSADGTLLLSVGSVEVVHPARSAARTITIPIRRTSQPLVVPVARKLLIPCRPTAVTKRP